MRIEYESYIPVSSSIVGKTIAEVEKEFNLKIDHIHKGPILPETKHVPTPETVLRIGMAIKILDVNSKILRKFVRHFHLP